MEKNIFLQKKQGFGSIVILLIVFYLVPGVWEDAKDDTGKKITYLICFALMLWGCGQAIYKSFFQKQAS